MMEVRIIFSRPVLKIVGTFVVVMSLLIIAASVYMICEREETQLFIVTALSAFLCGIYGKSAFFRFSSLPLPPPRDKIPVTVMVLLVPFSSPPPPLSSLERFILLIRPSPLLLSSSQIPNSTSRFSFIFPEKIFPPSWKPRDSSGKRFFLKLPFFASPAGK